MTECLDYEELFDLMFHEVRNINKTLAHHAAHLSISAHNKDFENSAHGAEKVYECSQHLKTWLHWIGYLADPTSLATDLIDWHPYKHLDVTIRNFKKRAKKNGVSIKLSGESWKTIRALPVIEVLPYILLENSFKYSPQNSNIYIDVNELNDDTIISVNSTGPEVNEDEIDLIFNRNYRGKHAEAYTSVGRGIGLSFAKTICELHNATITVASGKSLFSYNDVPFSNFCVTVSFPKR